MPTYVYRCDQCGNHLEVIQKFSDAPLKICPKCQGQLKRVIHATSVVFKGSGWYITDSRKGSSGSGESKAGAAAKSAETKPSEAKSESKSEPAATAPSSAD